MDPGHLPEPVSVKAESLNVGMTPTSHLLNGMHSPVAELSRIEELLSELQREYSSSDKLPV